MMKKRRTLQEGGLERHRPRKNNKSRVDFRVESPLRQGLVSEVDLLDVEYNERKCNLK